MVATLFSDRRTLEALVLGTITPSDARSDGTLTIDGDTTAVERLFAMFDTFPLMFDVVD